MLSKQTRALVLLVSMALSSLLIMRGAAAGPNDASEWPPLDIQFTGSLAGETVIYSITLKNNSPSDVADIFISGLVPTGSGFVRALNTPTGSWFRGFEGAGTKWQSVAWLADRVPAKGTLGPFMYQVDRGTASDLGAHGWAHWRLPVDGSAVSIHVDPAGSPPLGMAPGGRYHDIHVNRLALECTKCHVSGAAPAGMGDVKDYQDPLAQTFNPADRRSCLLCHQSGPKEFYGEGWENVAVRR